MNAARWRRIGGLIRKESIQILRDPSSLLIAGVLPLVLLVLFGFGVSLDANRLPIGLALEDTGAQGQRLARVFAASRFFDVRVDHDRRHFEDDLAAGHLKGIVVVARGFEARLARGDPASVQVITDGTEANTARFVENYARGAWQVWRDQRAIDAGDARPVPVALEPRFWFNPELQSRNYLVPGSIAVIMTLIGTLLTALVVAREWERGTMEALLSTPVGTVDLLAGKLVPYFGLGMAAMAMATLLATQVFGVPLRGSVGWLIVATAVFLVAALAMGLLISTLARNQFQAAQIAVISAFLPAFLLSGFVFEIDAMPPVIQAITHIVPARYFVACLQTLFLVGDIPAVLLPNLAVLTGFAGGLVVLVGLKTRQRLEG